MRLRTVAPNWLWTFALFVGVAVERRFHCGLSFAVGALIASVGLTIVWLVQNRRMS